MSPEIAAIVGLAVMFIIATILPINMGALALVGAFIIGLISHMPAKDIFAGFPGDLFVTLVGITYLFAIAQNNGTIDWLVRRAVWLVRGRIAAIPWVMFTDRRRAHERRRCESRRRRDHCTHRAAVGAQARSESAADGSHGDPRRAGRRLLADKHLWRHYQPGRRARRLAAGRHGAVPGQPDVQLRHRSRDLPVLSCAQSVTSHRPGRAGSRSRGPAGVGRHCAICGTPAARQMRAAEDAEPESRIPG